MLAVCLAGEATADRTLGVERIADGEAQETWRLLLPARVVVRDYVAWWTREQRRSKQHETEIGSSHHALDDPDALRDYLRETEAGDAPEFDSIWNELETARGLFLF
ncbi:MAG: hypothetical protein R3E97_19590 [Candidatus Eisenbacteria bacterium]